VEVRRFGTNVMELERLRVWLKEMGCTEAVMESTGSYCVTRRDIFPLRAMESSE